MSGFETSGSTGRCAEQRRRALVVDDERIVQDIVCEILAEAGFEVSAVTDAELGRSALEESRFDLLIADLNLPGTRGDSLCLDAKRMQANIRAILMTGDIVLEGDRESSTAGVDLVLEKPFDVRGLLAAIEAVFGDPRPVAEAKP